MIDWDSVDTVLLDMDGTLLDLQFDNWFWQRHVPDQYALAKKLPRPEAHRLLHDWINSHLGTLNWYCLDFWRRELGLDVTELKRKAANGIAIRPGAESFLQTLRDSDKQVVMVTNAHRDALAIKLEKTGIGDYFQHIVSSHDYGHAKEAQPFWQTLQRQLPFHVSRAVLVDDSLPVLHSAQRFGIGQTVSIRHPDSSLAPRLNTDPFPAIDDFASVFSNGSEP